MIPLVINISGAIERLSLSEKEMVTYGKGILYNLSDRYRFLWEKQVTSNLRQTKQAYLNAINVEYPNELTAVFVLDGRGENKLALKIEMGSAPFDMKEGILASPNARKTVDGKPYVNVPFRPATSQAIAESAIFSSKLPFEVEQLAKGADRPLSTSDLPAQFQKPGRRAAIDRMGVNVPAYDHQFPLYQGLQRSKIGSGYRTFRRVSEASDILSWYHKGFDQKNLMNKALNDLSLDVGAIVRDAERKFLENR